MAEKLKVAPKEKTAQLERTLEFNEYTAYQTKEEGRQSLVIICEPNSKRPARASVQNERMEKMEVFKYLRDNPEYNVGHALTTNQLDIDFDEASDFVIKCFEYFMPHTAFKVGRDGKHNSHWLYNLQDSVVDRLEEFKHVMRFLNEAYKLNDQKMKIEFRYRPFVDNDFTQRRVEQNPYFLAPGSIHPETGSLIYWHDSFNTQLTVSRHYSDLLIKRAVLAALASMIVPYWEEGSRQYMCLALAGSLYRFANVRTPTNLDAKDKTIADMMVDPDALAFTLEDFELLIQGICDLAGDPDVGERMSALRQTWHKANSDTAKIVGMPTLRRFLGDTADYVQNSMFHLISGISSEINVQTLVEKYAIWVGTGSIIDAHRINKRNVYIYPRRAFADSYADKRVWWRGQSFTLEKFVYTSGVITKVDGVDFIPPKQVTVDMFDRDVSDIDDLITEGEEGGQYVNIYRRPNIAPCKEPVSEEDIEPFISYIKSVFGYTDDRYNYIMAFLANLFQHPRLRPSTYLVLVGEQGTGKSFLFDRIVKPILGGTLHYTTSDAREITKQFNTALEGRLLIVFEEAIARKNQYIANAIKHFITGETITIEQKRVDTREVRNYARAVFISNNEDNAVALDSVEDERRAVVIRATSVHKQDIGYFSKLADWCNENLDKIHRFFLEYEYDPKVLANAMKSREKLEIQKHVASHQNPELEWVLEGLEEGFPILEAAQEYWFEAYHTSQEARIQELAVIDRATWPDRISAKLLKQDLSLWMAKNGYSSYQRRNIHKRIEAVLPTLDSAPRKKISVVDRQSNVIEIQPRLHVFPTRSEIINHLRTHYNHLVKDRLDEITQEAKQEQE